MVDKGGRGLVLMRFFTVGSPFSAIRGARFGSGPRCVTQFRLLLGCGFIVDGANFFLHSPSENPLAARVLLC